MKNYLISIKIGQWTKLFERTLEQNLRATSRNHTAHVE